jgi:hypothetical protein
VLWGFRQRILDDPLTPGFEAVCPCCSQPAQIHGLIRQATPTIFLLPLEAFRISRSFLRCGRCGTTVKPGDIASIIGTGATTAIDPRTNCDRCHAAVRSGAEFCSRCGAAAQAAKKPALPIPPLARSSPWSATVLAAAIVAALFVPVIIVLSRASRQSAPPPPVQEIITVPPRHREPAPVALAPPSTAPAVAPAADVPHQFQERVETAMFGPKSGGPFRTTTFNDEPIIGFEVVPDHWMKATCIRTLEPIYPSDHLLPNSTMIIARSGYAVSGVWVAGEQRLSAMRIQFMRFKGGQPVKNDTYCTDWIGEPSGPVSYLLGGDGAVVVGIYGRRGLNVDSLGLILLTQASSASAR